MTWSLASPNLNPIENYWSLLKRELFVGGKQYSSKESLWNEMVAITEVKEQCGAEFDCYNGLQTGEDHCEERRTS